MRCIDKLKDFTKEEMDKLQKKNEKLEEEFKLEEKRNEKYIDELKEVEKATINRYKEDIKKIKEERDEFEDKWLLKFDLSKELEIKVFELEIEMEQLKKELKDSREDIDKFKKWVKSIPLEFE